MKSFAILQPVESLFPENSVCKATADTDVAVVLIPGYMERPGAFKSLSSSLKDDGFYVHHYRPDQYFSSIAHHALNVAQLVDRIKSDLGFKHVVLLGHSMGGVIARYTAKIHMERDQTLTSVVTIASPNQGTLAAYLGIGQCVAEMLPGSDFLTALNESYQPLSLKTLCLQADQDVLVSSVGAEVHGATNHLLKGTGHMTILEDPRTADCISKFIRTFP